MKNKKRGFTIVELVVVIAVIGILAAVLIPTFSNITEKAEKSAALQEASSALTIVLTEENGQLETSKFDYYFISNGYWYEYKDGGLTAVPKNTLEAVKAKITTDDKVYAKDVYVDNKGTTDDTTDDTYTLNSVVISATALEIGGVVVWKDAKVSA